jgi:hypothetical protein
MHAVFGCGEFYAGGPPMKWSAIAVSLRNTALVTLIHVCANRQKGMVILEMEYPHT